MALVILLILIGFVITVFLYPSYVRDHVHFERARVFPKEQLKNLTELSRLSWKQFWEDFKISCNDSFALGVLSLFLFAFLLPSVLVFYLYYRRRILTMARKYQKDHTLLKVTDKYVFDKSGNRLRILYNNEEMHVIEPQVLQTLSLDSDIFTLFNIEDCLPYKAVASCLKGTQHERFTLAVWRKYSTNNNIWFFLLSISYKNNSDGLESARVYLKNEWESHIRRQILSKCEQQS